MPSSGAISSDALGVSEHDHFIDWPTALYAAAGLAIALAPAAVSVSGSDAPAPRSTAECENVETQDSFSMNCAPSVIPDTSDQLTEQEVVEPGSTAADLAAATRAAANRSHVVDHVAPLRSVTGARSAWVR